MVLQYSVLSLQYKCLQVSTVKKKKVTPAFIEYEAKLHPLPQEVLELVMIVQSNSLSVVTCILSHFIMHASLMLHALRQRSKIWKRFFVLQILHYSTFCRRNGQKGLGRKGV